jgi:hypothetical protein
VGIEELRNLLYTNKANVDNNSDNDIFIIDTDGTSPVVISDGEIPYDGYEYFHTYYNTNFTPRSNVVRHGNIIKSNSWKSVLPIKSQKTDKQFELEVNGIDENSDISVSELGETIFIPELYIFESYLTPANIQTLLSNPHGYIDFHYNGVSYSGFIHKIELTDNNRKANFELIAKDNSIINRTFTDGKLHVFSNGNQMINA